MEEKNEDEKAELVLQNDAQEFLQAVQRSQGDLNQVPPQPGQMMQGGDALQEQPMGPI